MLTDLLSARRCRYVVSLPVRWVSQFMDERMSGKSSEGLADLPETALLVSGTGRI